MTKIRKHLKLIIDDPENEIVDEECFNDLEKYIESVMIQTIQSTLKQIVSLVNTNLTPEEFTVMEFHRNCKKEIEYFTPNNKQYDKQKTNSKT